MSKTQQKPVRKSQGNRRRPFHQAIDREILMAITGWEGDRPPEKLAVLESLFRVLLDSAMPKKAARKLAKDYAGMLERLQRIGASKTAEIVEIALDDLRSR